MLYYNSEVVNPNSLRPYTILLLVWHFYIFRYLHFSGLAI